MPNDCKHPFKHAGAGRTDRLLKALMPSNVALDNRDMADLMVFAARFGKVVKYWDTNNAPDGDWSCFWESDYLFFLATVAASNTEGSEKAFRELEKKLLDNQETAPSVESKRADIIALIHIIRELALDMASWGQKADAFPALQQDITTIVRNTLQQPLRDLIAYAKGLPYPNDFAAFISTQNRHPFAKEWNITQFDFEQNIDFIDPTIDYFASWQALRKIFRRFVLAHERVRKQAEKYLQATQNDPTQRQHPPHIVLFISFLHLFKHLQDQLNALPEKHLDYYYNDILHLQHRGEIPDHAHLVFQLALNVYQQTLPVGTLFRAGKSPDGKDMFYTLERPLTLNQAQVVEVKTLLRFDTEWVGSVWENTILDTDKKTEAPKKMKDILPFRPLGQAGGGKKALVGFAVSSKILPKSQSNKTVLFSFKLNRDDTDKLNARGGFQLLNDNLKVEVSGKEAWVIKHEPIKQMFVETLSSITSNSQTTLSIRIADKRGSKVLNSATITVTHGQSNTNALIEKGSGLYIIKGLMKDDVVNVALSGYLTLVLPFDGSTLPKNEVTTTLLEEDNANLERVVVTATGSSAYSFNRIVVLKNEPAFGAPNGIKNNTSLYNLTEPAVKFSLNEDAYAYEAVYDLLSTLTLNGVTAEVNVTDLTDFDIYEGSINRPLGHTQNVDLTSAARQGGLIVRCNEAFTKGLDKLTLRFDNKSIDVTITEAYLFINGGKHDASILQISVPKTPINKNAVEIANIQSLLTNSEKAQDQLDAYLDIRLTYTRPTAQTFDSPTFTDAYIDYTIIKDLDETEFFHLSSHGGHEAVDPTNSSFFPSFPNPEPAFTEGVDNNPKFGFSESRDVADINTLIPAPLPLYRGNLFIGVKEPPKLGIVSLLFQVADGTEVDLDSFPPDIDWSYLSGNQWQRFPSRNIVFDSTKADEGSKRSLVQSGVIEFQMPADAKKDDTLLNPAYYWIRASATETATPIQTTVGALPSIVGIFAQAGSVRLATLPMDSRHFHQALPPQTINQLKFRQAAVKLIEQPYEGFGGRADEQGDAYHLRISERLRHKKRAITAWDYEHLVLQKFPEVRFVKCINHSYPETNLVNGKKLVTLNTLRTGAVAVVVMPLKTTKPLRPQTNRSTLENIKSYLKKYSNGFTSGDDLLQVIPPQYQAVVVSLRVKFQAGDTEKLVHNLDNDIARFIAPWAFDAAIEPTFGQNLYRTTLLSQIEALDYVDYIEDFYIENADKAVITKPPVSNVKIGRTVSFTPNETAFIEPNDARTLLTAHQLTAQTPFETNNSITPL